MIPGGNAATTEKIIKSPEGVVYINEAVTPLATKKKNTTKSPEGAIYDNEAVTPLATKKKITTHKR
ncbi:MAG: hypothetical protein IPG87_14580 [Saprospiraceae bacterium]|nr:hypothetical protein [Candidatus Vicinibacter affinis]